MMKDLQASVGLGDGKSRLAIFGKSVRPSVCLVLPPCDIFMRACSLVPTTLHLSVEGLEHIVSAKGVRQITSKSV